MSGAWDVTTGSLKITQHKSGVGYARDQRATLRTLGLHKIGQTVTRPDSRELRGQILAVRHLIEVEEIHDEQH